MKSSIFSAGFSFIVVISLSCKKPKACIEPSVTTADLGEEVTFIDCSENANNYKYDFGDGNSVTNEVPVHAYTKPGTYTVTVKVTNKNDKHESTASTSVSVKGITVGDFTANNWVLYKTVELDDVMPGMEMNVQTPGHIYQFTIDSLFINDGFSLPMTHTFNVIGENQFEVSGTVYTVLKVHENEIWFRTFAMGPYTKYFLKKD